MGVGCMNMDLHNRVERDKVEIYIWFRYEAALSLRSIPQRGTIKVFEDED